jgi:hypothetical protein
MYTDNRDVHDSIYGSGKKIFPPAKGTKLFWGLPKLSSAQRKN